MIQITAKLKIPRSAYKVEVKGRLELPFEARQKSRFKAKLASGEEVGVLLPRGEILRGGELGEGYLRIAADHVLERMVEGLGAKVTIKTAPFEPEAGAYAGVGHEHGA